MSRAPYPPPPEQPPFHVASIRWPMALLAVAGFAASVAILFKAIWGR